MLNFCCQLEGKLAVGTHDLMPRHGCSFLNVERIGGLVDWICACA
jgi:hypothetical protein